MIGNLVYIVVETTNTDSTIMSVHASEETARVKKEKLKIDFPQCSYWVDILRIKE